MGDETANMPLDRHIHLQYAAATAGAVEDGRPLEKR